MCLSFPAAGMADYSDLRSYGSGASKNERAKEQVRTQLAVQSAQELIQVWCDALTHNSC